MNEEEQQAAYEFIVKDNEAFCHGLTVENVQAIHHGIMNNFYQGPFSGDPCFSSIRSGLEAQGLLPQDESSEEFAARLLGGDYRA